MPRLRSYLKLLHLFLLLVSIAVLGCFFAMVEIQIEGSDGWAAKLPTWRIESGSWLNYLFGDRPVTGYHVWVFSFMALVFHFPLVLFGQFSLRLEARIIASLMLFWIIEDFAWFAFNPAYGTAPFFAGTIPWHKHLILYLPHDYWISIIAGGLLLWYSFRSRTVEQEHL